MATATATVTATARGIEAVVAPSRDKVVSPIVAKMRDHFLSLDIPLPAMPLMSKGCTLFRDHEQRHLAQLEGEPEITCWLLDTRNMWKGDNILAAEGAAQCLSLIGLPEQNTITSKMFISDAKMSLGSALLKRLFISQTLEIPWKEVKLGRKGHEKHGKPCAVDDVGRPIDGIDFNVSHQNGLVSFIGWNGRRRHRYSPGGHIQGVMSPGMKKENVMVGTDIVCVNERDSAATTIDMEGFDGWVDIYDSVFSDEERWCMKYDVDYVTLLDGTILQASDIGRHDRCISRHKDITLTTPAAAMFYTYFCYKEAYIKLAGEALLAPWLKQLEFFNVRSPKPGVPARCPTHGVWGEEVDDIEVKMHGKHVDDVKMKIQAFEEDFMLSVAIQGNIQGLKIPAFKTLDLQKDILALTQDFLNEPPRKTLAPEVKEILSPISPWESRYWS